MYECLGMNELHCTYHMFCIFICLLFQYIRDSMLSLAHVYINFNTSHSKVVT